MLSLLLHPLSYDFRNISNYQFIIIKKKVYNYKIIFINLFLLILIILKHQKF